MPSNSHKIEGLIKISGIPIPVCSNARELSSAIRYCKNNKNAYEEFFPFLESYRPLSTFEALGTDNDIVVIEDEIRRLEDDINQHSRYRNSNLWSLSNINYDYSSDLLTLLKGKINQQVNYISTRISCRMLHEMLPAKAKCLLKKIRGR